MFPPIRQISIPEFDLGQTLPRSGSRQFAQTPMERPSGELDPIAQRRVQNWGGGDLESCAKLTPIDQAGSDGL
jgi:hypothetical protein